MTNVQNRLPPSNPSSANDAVMQNRFQNRMDVFKKAEISASAPQTANPDMSIVPEGSGHINYSPESVQILDQMANDLLDHLLPPDPSRSDAENLSTRLEFIREQAPELQREMTMFREVVRQVREAVFAQGMDIMQALNMLRVDQGGALYQRFQDFLSKTFPLERNQFFQKLENLSPEAVKNIFGSAEALGAFLQKNQSPEAQSRNPALAVLEMVKGEINPQQPEHFLVALQIFSKEFNTENTQKLLSYLKRRGVLDENEYLRYMQSFRAPPEQHAALWGKEEIKPIRFWYILLAVLCFVVSYGIEHDFVVSLLVGLGMAGLMGLLNFMLRKK
ncbi:MAG: hypothetical protein HQM15_05540 [Deltaproteobacteria bacterium]|nr:hypothetical protein [Deltaproteobacteria bacterium]